MPLIGVTKTVIVFLKTFPLDPGTIASISIFVTLVSSIFASVIVSNSIPYFVSVDAVENIVPDGIVVPGSPVIVINP